jgi:hypothetical protein
LQDADVRLDRREHFLAMGGPLLHESDELVLLFLGERPELDLELGFVVLASSAACLDPVGKLGVALALGAFSLGGCDSETEGPQLDPTPTEQDGSPSTEFELADIEPAESASPEVQAYCASAVSAAQRIGCLSHVDESDIP